MIDKIKGKKLIEAVEAKGEGIVIPMLDSKDLQVKASAVVPPTYIDAIECHQRWSDRFNKQCAEVVEAHKDVLDFEDRDRVEGNKPAIAEKPLRVKDQMLTEATHAAVAKPEGDRVKAYNNALRYAKRDGVPYCYGYTNSRLAGKFFAFDQPFKWDGDDKAFRAQQKNTSTIYVAYPDKAFIKEGYLDPNDKVQPKSKNESLNEGLERTFIELPSFKASWKDLGLTEEDLRALQNLILSNPEQGIPLGTNVYKIRFKPVDANYGKNKADRAIYIDIIKDSKIYLVIAFSKADEDNITEDELGEIRALAKEWSL